jgi:hypothetical protein
MAPAMILLVILAAAIVLAALPSPERAIALRVRRGAPARLADLTDGAVAAVSGRVRASSPEPAMAAPLSRRACLYYEVEVQAFDASSIMWVTVHAEARGRAFLLDDGSATALVEAGGWRIAVDRLAAFAPAEGPRAQPVERLLARRGLDWLCRRRLRVRERVLCEGQRVGLLGACMREPDPDPAAAPGGYRASALRPVLRAGRRAPLYITDHVDS